MSKLNKMIDLGSPPGAVKNFHKVDRTFSQAEATLHRVVDKEGVSIGRIISYPVSKNVPGAYAIFLIEMDSGLRAMTTDYDRLIEVLDYWSVSPSFRSIEL